MDILLNLGHGLAAVLMLGACTAAPTGDGRTGAALGLVELGVAVLDAVGADLARRDQHVRLHPSAGERAHETVQALRELDEQLADVRVAATASVTRCAG